MGILEHLQSAFGQPGSLLRHSDDMDVWVWEDAGCQGVVCVSTVGMSDRTQPPEPGRNYPSVAPRIELMMYCHTPDADRIAELLLDLSRYAFERGNRLSWWQTIPLGAPIARGSSLTGLLLTIPPLEADDVTFNIGKDRRDLVQVVPITVSELEFCRRHGIDAFEELLEGVDIDIADLSRSTVV